MVIHDVWQHAGQEVRFDSELLALYQELTSPKLLCQPGFLEMSQVGTEVSAFFNDGVAAREPQPSACFHQNSSV